MEEQGSNHGGAGARVGGKSFHVGEWMSKAPTMVGVASVGTISFDVGEWRSKAPTMVGVSILGKFH